MNQNYCYITKIIAYISPLPYLIMLIFTIRSFNSLNIIHILNLQLLIVAIANTSTYCFPFYEDNKSIGCTIQSLLCFSTMFITSFIVMFITYLNINFSQTPHNTRLKQKGFIFQYNVLVNSFNFIRRIIFQGNN